MLCAVSIHGIGSYSPLRVHTRHAIGAVAESLLHVSASVEEALRFTRDYFSVGDYGGAGAFGDGRRLEFSMPSPSVGLTTRRTARFDPASPSSGKMYIRCLAVNSISHEGLGPFPVGSTQLSSFERPCLESEERSLFRPRKSRDFAAPREIPCSFATSSNEHPVP